MLVKLGDEIKIVKAQTPIVSINWQEDLSSRSKQFYCIPFSTIIDDDHTRSSLFCEIGLVKKLLSSATNDPNGANNDTCRIKITEEFRYGQDIIKNTRFLVYGDKNDKICQYVFMKDQYNFQEIITSAQKFDDKKVNAMLQENKDKFENSIGDDFLRDFGVEDNRAMLSILQYNIQSGTGIDGVYDISRIANVINNLSPDLVAVQEIEIKCLTDCYGKDLPSLERKNADQPKELSNLTGLQCFYEEKTKQFGGSYGTAALTNLEVLQKEKLSFVSWDAEHKSNLLYGKLPQVAVLLKVKYHAWKLPIWFVSVHLGCDLSGNEQLHEIKELITFINNLLQQESGEMPHVIISGDFNCLPAFQAVKALSEAGYQDCWNTSKYSTGSLFGFTFKSNFPAARLDYVFASANIDVVSAKVISSDASDHFPLFVCLKEKN